MNETDIALCLNDHNHEIGSLKHRVTDCERIIETIHSLVTSVDKLASNMERMAKEQESQGERLTTLEQAPGDAWKDYKRTIINCVSTGVIGAIIGALLAIIF